VTLYQVTSQDFDVLVRESRKRGIDPRDVAIVLYIESAGFDPASAGGGGAANGLNQMMPENLRSIGFTPEAWRALSAAEQLPFIFRWWDSMASAFRPAGFPPTAGDLGALNFLPGRYKERGAATNPDAPLTAAPEKFYERNTFYDPVKSGAISVNTMRARQQLEARGARWQLLLSGIAAAENRSTTPAEPPRFDGPPSIAVAGLPVPAMDVGTETPRRYGARSGTAGAHLFIGALVLVFGCCLRVAHR
jgi:hypothetical protein